VSRAREPGAAIARLVEHLVDGDGTLEASLTAWLADSSAFRAFAEAHRDKIRKKLRTAADADARRDVMAELRVAHLLLRERRLTLAFEAYGAGRGGPDFTADFRGERSFNVEVTRLRRPPTAANPVGPLLAKLRQLPPSVPNVLVIAMEGARASAHDTEAAVRAVRARADAKDEDFFTARGLAGTRGFYDRFLRLGAVIAWCEDGAGDERASAWTNASARIPVPPRALRACVACLRTDGPPARTPASGS
jgi:hypothetical protein